MIARCRDKNHKNYVNYGAKGIDVCDEWVSNPDVFIEWSLKNGWSQGLEIDRINNNKGYCPENCRFVNHSFNQRHRNGWGKSKYRNIDFYKSLNKWRARVWVDKKRISIGYFDTELEALISLNAAVKNYFPDRPELVQEQII